MSETGAQRNASAAPIGPKNDPRNSSDNLFRGQTTISNDPSKMLQNESRSNLERNIRNQKENGSLVSFVVITFL